MYLDSIGIPLPLKWATKKKTIKLGEFRMKLNEEGSQLDVLCGACAVETWGRHFEDLVLLLPHQFCHFLCSTA